MRNDYINLLSDIKILISYFENIIYKAEQIKEHSKTDIADKTYFFFIFNLIHFYLNGIYDLKEEIETLKDLDLKGRNDYILTNKMRDKSL